MNLVLRIALLIGVIAYFAVLIMLLRKKKLELKYSLLWIFFGFVMLLIVALPNVVRFLMKSIGIIEMTNGVFAIVMFALLIILMSLTSIVSKLNSDIRELVQKCSMYEKRIRELESENEKNN